MLRDTTSTPPLYQPSMSVFRGGSHGAPMLDREDKTMRRVTQMSCFGLVLLSIFIWPSILPSMVWGQAPIAPPTAITGVYDGQYRCARGPVNLTLTLVAPGDGSLTGVFTFDLPANSRTRTASYTVSGRYDAATGGFRLVPVKWEPPAPPGFVMVGMEGAFNPSAEQVSGKITYPTCTTFEATRNKVQSAALAKRPAVTPAAPAAGSAPANANQTSASAAARPAPAAPAAEGTAQTTSAPQGQDYAQTNIPPNIAEKSALKKKACDFITPSDAESILGQPVEMNLNNTSVCSFISANKVPPIKQVHFSVWFEGSPDDYAVVRKDISDHQGATEVVKDLPNFSDAAIWRWIPPAWGQLSAFKGGTIRVVVSITGIPEDAALQNAKALAARPLGATARTGYVYAPPLPKTVAPAALPPRKALVAGSEPPLKNVALSVCNAGKVDIDVLVAVADTLVSFENGDSRRPSRSYDVAKQVPIRSSHIVPSACARVYSENVGLPIYVGLALVDSRGQWGTARGLHNLPDFGIGDGRQGERPDVLTFTDKSVSFRRAEKEVAAQLRLFFRPRTPTCWSSYRVHRPGPFGGTTTEEIREDPHRVPSSEAFDASCETLPYVLNVVGYPDSRDIKFTEAKKAD